MQHIDDRDDLEKARALRRMIDKLGLPAAERNILREGLILYVESRLQVPVIRQESHAAPSGFSSLGSHARGL
ncbi:MAG: hypothetical protein KUA43_13850 [Hoeflea sp.]|uniref:hypothetical protein n=1 Tax=Hoeflea sp. TaxID=1940281 RepID=UPI001DE45449|nr:hypothetical protein [Hoeflea sp.]MBU4531242.1 hypothetical protein [Alphaproteobacteria bacterium]MBU4545695.1 hypothetical protein [Alphaproteobacteria bacterium]MBU4550664.1 hypothetical protein [Alphaproteobacteria bacterium]MBV1724519.1 hypothetical protein [Hoeflea sp.]MBV1760539.1 hypothetical protein [Hoeflea sp.]